MFAEEGLDVSETTTDDYETFVEPTVKKIERSTRPQNHNLT